MARKAEQSSPVGTHETRLSNQFQAGSVESFLAAQPNGTFE